MKILKQLKKLLLLLSLVTFGAAQAQAQEAYAVITSEFFGETLTFYYDDLRSTRVGTQFSVNGSLTDTTIERWLLYKASFKMVVFDSSFAAYHPTGTANWFYGFENLASIFGIQYLNTDLVTDMRSMFYNCSKLTSHTSSRAQEHPCRRCLQCRQFRELCPSAGHP